MSPLDRDYNPAFDPAVLALSTEDDSWMDDLFTPPPARESSFERKLHAVYDTDHLAHYALALELHYATQCTHPINPALDIPF